MNASTAALLLTVYALPGDGGTPTQTTMAPFGARECPDAPVAEHLDGGWFLPEQRAQRVACLLEQCERGRAVAENEGRWPVVLMAGLIGVVSGAAVAYVIWRR